MSALTEARALFSGTTPLETDCGRLCGAACCRSLPGEETGMLLFPGEEALVRGFPGFRVIETAAGPALVCGGACDRETRPLSCRIFPLLPLLRPEGVKVAVDARARAVCPISRLSACREDFVEAVRRAGQLLCADPDQRAFLEELTRQHDELRALQKRFGR